MCKSGEACCYFLGYKMSLQKTMNDKSCVSCKEDDHARVFCIAIVLLCLYFNKSFENTRRLVLMHSLRRSLDMPKARFPRRRSSKIRIVAKDHFLDGWYVRSSLLAASPQRSPQRFLKQEQNLICTIGFLQ